MKKKIIIVLVVLLVILGAAFGFLDFVTGGILSSMLFDCPARPMVKEAEFPFQLVYEYKGQQYTVNEAVVCEYEGVSFALDSGKSRAWNCYVTNNDSYGRYYLDEARYPTLYVQVPLNADYYMGAPNANPAYPDPYIFFIDESTGTTYYEQDLSDVVGAKIISFEISEPLAGNIKK